MVVRNFAHHAKPLEAAKEFRTPCEISHTMRNFACQTTSEDDFSRDEWLGFTFLGVMEARDIEGRLVKIETPQETELEVCLNIMNVPPKDQIANMYPTSHCATLPTFHGMESENPYSHIKEFEEVCNTFQEGRASIDLMRLKLFPFTLKDKAKIWLNSLRPRSIRTWTDLQAEFLKKYMEPINACPHHGFDTWLLVSYFYDGMSSSMKQLLETMCGGDFMSKNPEEAMDFLSYVAEVSR
ncbi:hypothetical protein CK203_104274 [Vitis vinifera]|uniref:Retrotransposon gag domain-containing protein n=1 Tax=Vitis vinifera TaxID=29760 RepID=A0A438C5W6_VITVI|nr:hypothetical protein CK203_104274 [Vitis vinifera]